MSYTTYKRREIVEGGLCGDYVGGNVRILLMLYEQLCLCLKAILQLVAVWSVSSGSVILGAECSAAACC